VHDAGPPAASAGADFPIAIIGAGFAGIGAAILLQKAGIRSFTIFERADEVGGTWRDNTYPGAACDVPAHVYSFSFEPSPDWSHLYARSGEIQRYLLGCVEKHGLRRHLRLNTGITEARFDERDGVWRLSTDRGDTVTVRAVLACMGGLVDPAVPDLKGLGDFEGEVFHTARWNHACDLRGLDVAVIGTGASAIQVIPEIAPDVARLSVFQRTPAWVVPRRDAAIGEAAKRRFARFPWLQKALRAVLYGLSELFGPIVFLDSPLSKIGERMSRRHLERSVRDPELRRKLMPDFQFGCKRVLISSDYWSTFERENVDLVTSPITEIRPASIVTGDGREHPADVIVLATGFDPGLAKAPFPVFGLDGRSLDEAWADGAVAYKGVTVSGIPNWFIMMGPNTGPGHTSVLVYTETQIRYAIQAIHQMMAEGLRWVTVKQRVQDAYNRGLEGRMKYMVWASGCHSWYLSPDGRNHTLYPGFASEYCLRARRFDPSEYDVARG
jgi:cation diffusion facilitator CzcD-associated flavoprotein CzcO